MFNSHLSEHSSFYVVYYFVPTKWHPSYCKHHIDNVVISYAKNKWWKSNDFIALVHIGNFMYILYMKLSALYIFKSYCFMLIVQFNC